MAVLVLLQPIIISAQLVQMGDLLFVTSSQTTLSTSINAVTQTAAQHNFTHVGMVEIDADDAIWVLHAGPRHGVERLTLDSFVAQSYNQNQQIAIYRLSDTVAINFDAVIAQAKRHLGKPYNYTYIRTDTAFYCADYIWDAFQQYDIFQLEPMTFIHPHTQDFDTGWVAHYQQLGIAIPEGKPGCNPNKMATNELLTFIQWLKAE